MTTGRSGQEDTKHFVIWSESKLRNQADQSLQSDVKKQKKQKLLDTEDFGPNPELGVPY